MTTIELDDELYKRVQKFAALNDTTIEAIVEEHLRTLPLRRLTVREQTYRDCEPPKERVEQLLREAEEHFRTI